MATKTDKKPKERIVDAISILFYKNGFRSTGIDDIVNKSGAHKASIYKHFADKDALATAYLNHRSDMLASFLEGICARSPDAAYFFKLWQNSLKYAAQSGNLYGCPLANLNAELGQDRAKFQTQITAVGERWQGIVSDFLRREQKAGRINKKLNLKETSRRIMTIYQGHLQIYNITRDKNILAAMASDMNALVE